jgi:MFS family permease
MEVGMGGRFRRLWIAAAVSNLGDGVGLTAFPLFVASLTRDPLLVAGATAALEVPWLLFALPAGALVDRVDRRLAMVTADFVRTVVVASLALLALLENAPIWAVYAVAFALSTAETVFDPASEAILPLMVERDELGSANSRLEGTNWALNYFVGPPLGAALFAVFAAAPFLIDSASFLAAALIVLTLPGAYRGGQAARQSIAAEVGGGIRWLLAHPVLHYTSPLAGLTNMAMTAIVSVFVLFAQDVVGVSDLGYGLLLSALGVGGLAGALSAGRVIARTGPAGALRLSVCLGAPTAIFVATIPNPVVVALGVFIVGVSTSLWNVTNITLRQQLVPDELRGRIAASSRLITWGSQPIGAAMGGATAAVFGLRAPFFLAAAILCLVALVTFARVTPGAIVSARRAAESAISA